MEALALADNAPFSLSHINAKPNVSKLFSINGWHHSDVIVTEDLKMNLTDVYKEGTRYKKTSKCRLKCHWEMSVKGNCEVKTRSGSLRKPSEKTGCMLGRKTKQSMPPKEMNVWLAQERQLTVPNKQNARRGVIRRTRYLRPHQKSWRRRGKSGQKPINLEWKHSAGNESGDIQ